MQCILYQQFMPLKSIHYKCVLTVSVVSSEDDLSPSATLCLFRQAEENKLLWHVDEQNCQIFLQGHAFQPSLANTSLCICTQDLWTLEALHFHLTAQVYDVQSLPCCCCPYCSLNLHLLHGSTANSTQIFLYPAALFIFL